MKKILFIVPLVLLTACSGNTQQEQLSTNDQITNNIEGNKTEKTSQEKINGNQNNKDNNKTESSKDKNQNKVVSSSLRQKIIQDIKNTKSMGDFEMMRFDCSGAMQFKDIYQICLKEKKQAEKRYWEKIKQRNQKVASFTLQDCEKVIGKRYKNQLEQVGKVPARDLLFALPPSENLTLEKLDKLSNKEVKQLIYKQMQQEINQCKLGFAFQKNICDELKDENLKQECKKLRSYYELQNKLEQVKSFDVRNYVSY